MRNEVKQIQSEFRQNLSLINQRCLDEARPNYGEWLLDPGKKLADKLDPEKAIANIGNRVGNKIASGLSGLTAKARNLLFGAKERSYRKFLQKGITQDKQTLEEQQKTLKLIRPLTKEVMIRELNVYFREYLTKAKYAPHITSQQKPQQQNNSYEFTGSLSDFLSEAESEGEYDSEDSRTAIEKSGGNPANAIEMFILKKHQVRISKEAKSAIAYHAILYSVARVFEVKLGRKFFSTANPVIYYTTEDLQLYKQQKGDPSVFFPRWFQYLPLDNRPTIKNQRTSKSPEAEQNERLDAIEKGKKVPDIEKTSKAKVPTPKQMMLYVTKMRNFRTIANFVNHDNIKSMIERDLQNVNSRQKRLDANPEAQGKMTVAQTIKAKMETFKSEAKGHQLTLNNMKKRFNELSDEEKNEKKKSYEEKFKKVQGDYNKSVSNMKKLKEMLSRYYDGEDFDKDEINNLDSFEEKEEQKDDGDSDKEKDKEKEKEDKDNKARAAHATFISLKSKIVQNANRKMPFDDARNRALQLIPTIIQGEDMPDRAQLEGEIRDSVEQAKEIEKEKQAETQNNSYEQSMDNFEFLIEKYTQEKRSPLMESMPMIRFRRNPRAGTNKIVMVCRKDEFKKSLNKTINVAGKKVKDVMCLPKQLKPAKDRLKDRKASVKRWRKIKTSSTTMERMNRKKQETKKASRTLRK